MADKGLKQYLAESKREYNFTVKLACDAVTETMLDRLEMALRQHDILTATAFKETPIQESPLDFPNVRHSKVFISEISTAYPATVELLRNQISQMLNISEQQVAVYNEGDPRRVNTEQYLAFLNGENKKGYVPYTGRDYGKDDMPDMPSYGEAYNTPFLKELMDSREPDKHVYNDLSVEQAIDHSNLTGEKFGEAPVEPTLFGRTKKPSID